MEYNIIFPRIFNDIPFNTILYSILRLHRNIISYVFLRSGYSPRKVTRYPSRSGKLSSYMLNTRNEEKNTVFYSYLACFVNPFTLNMYVSMPYAGLARRNT